MFKFFGAPKPPTAPAVVEQDPRQKNTTELTDLLEEYGKYSVSDGGYAGDNRRRDELLETIIPKIANLPREEIERAYADAHLNGYEKNVLDFEINKNKITNSKN